MLTLRAIPKHQIYGFASIACPLTAISFLAFVLLQQESYSPEEAPLADFGGFLAIILLLWSLPITAFIGFCLGIISFVRQKSVNGIGLWTTIINAILLILCAFLWMRFTALQN
jgi:hypothetical protein